MEKDQTADQLKLTRIFFFINALVWLGFALLGFILALQGAGSWRGILSAFMLVNAAVFAWFGVKIVSGKAWVFFFGILFVALNVVLSFTDQFGWIDALILLLNLCLLGMLVVTRQRINQVKSQGS